MPQFEFHVSRRARDVYGFDESLFRFNGTVIFADFHAARVFAHKINAKRPPSRAVRSGRINALGLIDELQHFVLRVYRERKNPDVLALALAYLIDRSGPDAVEDALRRFTDEFPPVAVYRNFLTVEDYLADVLPASGSETSTSAALLSGGIPSLLLPSFPETGVPSSEPSHLPNRQIALEEMLMLRLANLNPAFEPFRELFDDTPLALTTVYPRIMADLRSFFDTQPRFGPDQENLIDFLRAPALAAPDSLAAQLSFIRERWGVVLGGSLVKLLGSLDFIREEEKTVFTGPGSAPVPGFSPDSQAASLALFGDPVSSSSVALTPSLRPPDPEPERFSVDLDWMPNLILMAKNSYVWLDQLAKKYGRAVARLDQIPDEELDSLRRAGITGLWLIGLWERSRASRLIKQKMGNPEAVASAYSLFDYAIAEDLGGDAALQDLKTRARRYGIRLASDMVPNHMGLDSRWVIEHPDWFIGLDRPPYPAYSYSGPDLSGDDRVCLQIEDHYYDRTDAAVVFKRTDIWTDGIRYIYHGNDGTSFPWNDTAQLDYLKAEVREAVIRTILQVARNFPVIRFDAAMTLAKRHFQRLWYPQPGTGGAIPSRSEHGLTNEAFDALIPEEFWREVVLRVATEAPDTLLLAEAFWLMEGYFVRTLGMHRVYNSAFMNMLRDEDNAKYRRVMKNTLEFDPEVLKRYVNFMNNPDERTAVEQFGDGDKYFGVCTLLATLPGLPMVGHGQIEGLTEKYGMEYRRAYYDESPKPWLMDRHAREIFPLFHKRYLFAGVADFLLYDLFKPEGVVDENVFVYSNGAGSERALVVYHNKYAETCGWIRTSAAFAVKTGTGENKILVRKKLGDGLGLSGDPSAWVIFKDHGTGLEYLRNSGELCEKGLFLELSAYRCHVFAGFREVQDDDAHRYSRLADELKNGGVPDIGEAVRELLARPVQTPFKELVNPGFFRWLTVHRLLRPDEELNPAIGEEVEAKTRDILDGIEYYFEQAGEKGTEFAAESRSLFEAILRLPVIDGRFPPSDTPVLAEAIRYLKSGLETQPEAKLSKEKSIPAIEPDAGAPVFDNRTAWAFLFGWASVESVLGLRDESLWGSAGSLPIEDWMLDRTVESAYREMGIAEPETREMVSTIKGLAVHPAWPPPEFKSRERARRLAAALFAEAHFRDALGVNTYQGVEYFNKEALERMLWRLLAATAVDMSAAADTSAGNTADALVSAFEVIAALRDAAAESGFRVDDLKRILTTG
jgi:glycosidase